MLERYFAQKQAQEIIKQVLCISYLPRSHVIDAFFSIKNIASESFPFLDPYFAYVERYWIHCIGNPFDIYSWNCYRRVRQKTIVK